MKILTEAQILAAAKQWAADRSVGDALQDDECEYDFKMGMIRARCILQELDNIFLNQQV